MSVHEDIHFGLFRLDVHNGCLVRGDETIHILPKDQTVLHILLRNAGNVVKKQDIMQYTWPDTTVSDDVLKACIKRIRKSLGDNYRAPRYIETVHRRGYRFICPVSTPSNTRRCRAPVAAADVPLPGRKREFKILETSLDKACGGVRQVVFVAGEAGTGKTALLEAFGGVARSRCSMIVVKGQCIEHYGEKEAYRPVLGALDRLCRSEHGPIVLDALRQCAPMWLMQMPWLVSMEEKESLRNILTGTGRKRMLRELVAVLETVAENIPVMIYLEELHWSDPATLDALNLIARRHEPARLMIVGTYRPEGLSSPGNPLETIIRELTLQGKCETMPIHTAESAALPGGASK